jgi:hypothetical protein
MDARSLRWAPVALIALFGVSSALALPMRQSTPDLRLLEAARLVWAAKADAAGTVQLPALASTRSSIPNVILIVTEGVRADSYCSAGSCPYNPAISRLLPTRAALGRMHALASFTVISMSAITTGRVQTVTRAELLGMPSVFDCVKALRTGGPVPYTAYWSVHNHPMFEREDIRASIDSYLTAESIVGDQEWHEDADAKLMTLFRSKLPSLPRPFFVVLHLVNTHTPYAVDPAQAPFSPWERDFSWEGMPKLRNTYLNSIVRQDRILADGLAPLVQSGEFRRTIVMFTSDHGEEFGEHKQIHHGQDLFDEQTRVPAWIAAGEDAVEPRAWQKLLDQGSAPTTHLDILPTILDVYGVLDSYGFGPYRKKLAGSSLLRDAREPSALPMSSCTDAFPCPFRNAGMLLGDLKLEAQEWDPGWNCWQSDASGERPVAADDPGCVKLRQESKRYFRLMPNGRENR